MKGLNQHEIRSHVIKLCQINEYSKNTQLELADRNQFNRSG
jgi:hypothetical protein